MRRSVGAHMIAATPIRPIAAQANSHGRLHLTIGQLDGGHHMAASIGCASMTQGSPAGCTGFWRDSVTSTWP